MEDSRFDFVVKSGHRLSGRLERPQSTPRGWAIFAHCFTCGKDNLAAVRVSRALALTGIGVLRFDFAGLGASGGDFADATFATDVEDLIAASRAMANANMAPSVLVGHSLGGAAAIAASRDISSLRAVVTIGSPSDVGQVLGHFDKESLARIEEAGEAELVLAGRTFTIRRSFVDDAIHQNLEARIAQVDKPLLILHAPDDTVVSIDNALRIFAVARSPKSFVALDGADHLLSRRDDADYAASIIAAWTARYAHNHA